MGDEELPDMIMRRATYVFGDKGRKPLIMNAETITVYSGKNGKTLLDKLSFTQEEADENGVSYVEMSGSCDSASINSDNTIAKLSGDIRLTKKKDNFSLQCNSLEWNDAEQIIKTDSEVNVTYEDGTTIKAIGFSAELDNNVYEFGQIIEGRFKNED